MAQRTIRQAINEAFDQEMERDSTVILMGEDIIGGTGSPGEEEAWGGAMGIYKGLYRKYGDRLLDTPLSEAAFVGAAIGAATCGMRPVAELMFIDFLGVCFRSDLQPGGQVPLHVRRQGGNPRGDSHHVRRRAVRRRPAFADVDLHLHPHPPASRWCARPRRTTPRG